MQTQGSTPAIVPDALDAALVRLAPQGWRLQLRTPTTMQLIKPKQFNPTEGALLAVVCVGLVLLGGGAGILLAILLAIGDVIWYACRRDQTMLVALDVQGNAQPIGATFAPAGRADPSDRCVCDHTARQHAFGSMSCGVTRGFGLCGCTRFYAATAEPKRFDPTA